MPAVGLAPLVSKTLTGLTMTKAWSRMHTVLNPHNTFTHTQTRPPQLELSKHVTVGRHWQFCRPFGQLPTISKNAVKLGPSSTKASATCMMTLRDNFHIIKLDLKMSSVKWQSDCLGLNELDLK